MLISDNKQDIDKDKILNIKCICKKGLPWIKDRIVMAYPCEHMYHEICFNKLSKKCAFCHQPIIKKLSLFDTDLHYQRFADILSVSYYDDMSYNTPSKFLDSLFDISSVIAMLPFTKSRMDARYFCERIFSLNNMTLRVHGLEKIKSEKNKVFICNHVSYFEMIILYYLLGSGFLASSTVDDSPVISWITGMCPLLIFNRGEKNRKINIVDAMKKFVEKHGSICLFPEGIMKHPDALARFRSGAFHINQPIFSVTIRHNDIISDDTMDQFIYKLGAKRNINIEVNIMGPYYPPFTKADIERIRLDMARKGNMFLSRVSNTDIVDL